MKRFIPFGTLTALLALSSACAHLPPQELADARTTYARASTGPAAKHTPAELHTAKVALDQAEKAFENDPEAQSTKDLAYVAERKAQIAEVGAVQAQNKIVLKSAEQAYHAQQAQIHGDTKAALAGANAELATTNMERVKAAGALNLERARAAVALDAARLARQNAEDKTLDAEQRLSDSEARNKDLEASLAKLAAFKEEARGLVLTLSGSVVFVSDSTTLLAGAQDKLDQIAEALISGGSRPILIEGHTDSSGAAAHNMDLSQRRADAVRSYIIGRGYPTDKVSSIGFGQDRPIADNASPEGRANNRRVELVILAE